MSKRKTVIIGAGHVGAHVASALMMQDICEEIILLDTDAQKAWSHAVDLQDTACYAGKNTTVCSGGYEELRDADICVISYCGAIFKENRLEELEEALNIADEIIPKIQASGFQGGGRVNHKPLRFSCPLLCNAPGAYGGGDGHCA